MTPTGWLLFALLLSAKALVVLAAAFGMTRMMRNRSAAERHLVWMLASVCVLALPVLSLAGPAWRVGVPQAWVDAISGEASAAPVPPAEASPDADIEVAPHAEAEPVLTPEAKRERVSRALGTHALEASAIPTLTDPYGMQRTVDAEQERAFGEAAPALDAGGEAPADALAGDERAEAGTGDPPAGDPRAGGAQRAWLPLVLLVVWGAGTLIVLARVVVGWLRVHRLGRSATPQLDPALLVRTHGIAAEIGLERSLRILEGDAAAMPVTFGILRPTLLLPSSARAWSGARQNAVLRHELEHVRRRDSLSQLLAEVGCALYWYNPLMWWASRRMCAEREHACDDAVLASGSRPSEYAAELVEIARTLRAPHESSAAIAMARTSHLRARVTSLLDVQRRRDRASTRLLVPAWAGAFLLVAPLASLAPQLYDRTASRDSDRAFDSGVLTAQSPAPEAPQARSGGSGVFAALASWAMQIDTPPPAPPAPPVSPVWPAAPASPVAPADLPAPLAPLAPLAWPTPGARNPPTPAPPAPAPWPIAPGSISAPAPPAPLSWASPLQSPAPPAPMPWSSPPQPPLAPAPMLWPSPSQPLSPPAPMPWPSPSQPPPPAPMSLNGAPQDCLSGGRATNVSSNTNDDRRTTKWSGSNCSGEVVIDGDVSFDAAFTTITGISRGGSVRIATEEDGVDRRVTITPGSDGLVYDYRVDGERQAFDTAGREWLSSTLLFMFRRFGFMAEERAASILQRGGADALLAEAGLLNGDYVRSRYLRVLVERGNLDASALTRVLALAGSTIDSDYYRTQIIKAAAGRYEFTEGVRSAYIGAVDGIDSDFYRHDAFAALLTKGRLTPAQVSAVLADARRIGSDYYRATLLTEIADFYSDAGIREAYLNAAAGIDSDHYKSSVLTNLFSMDGMTTADLVHVVDASSTIDSDHYQARLLGQVVNREQLDNATLRAVLEAAENIHSDHNRSELLILIARRHHLEGESRTLFEHLMREIDSRTNRGRVAEALLRNG